MILKGKIRFYMLVGLIMFSVFGCTKQTEGQAAEQTAQTEQAYIEKKEVDQIIEIYQDILEKIDQQMDDWDNLQKVSYAVDCFGKSGYVAIDSENQVNMTHAQQVEDFCAMVDAKQEATLTILEMTYDLGLKIYHFQCQDGTVHVARMLYEYQNETIQFIHSIAYTAENWNQTKEGYLLFSGSWYAKDFYVLTLSDAEEHVAFRVQPLDPICRAWNRKYIASIGYQKNNMFLVDWTEKNYGELDLYDLFDIFYERITGNAVPYTMDENLAVGAVYQIPKEEFESVLMTFLNIDSQTIQSKTIYHAQEQTYEYKPRGFYEIEYPEYPYSEVIGYTKNEDGTITLTVNVVFPYRGIAKVFAHEVVIRPLENGGVQYVANRVIPSEDNDAPMWYHPRLTQTEWEEVYGQ